MDLKENIRLSGAYEQYQKIQGSTVPQKTESETFTVSSVADIAGRLEDYVGSAGKYMPFTSKVSITLPLEGLKGISVIDTPGFNDPVPSRDDRARMALRECDVIFILSRATPFLGQNKRQAGTLHYSKPSRRFIDFTGTHKRFKWRRA